jgi:hypothetical protein
MTTCLRSLLALLLATLPALAVGAVGGGGGSMGGPGGGYGNGNNNNNNNNIQGLATVDGCKFLIVVADPDNQKKRYCQLLFKTKDASSDFLSQWNIESLAYSEKAQSTTLVDFSGELTDADGNSVKLSGTCDKGAVTGAFTVYQKDGNKSTEYSFHGGLPGSDEAKAAKTEADQAGSKK